MVEAWFAIFWFAVVAYAVLDGGNLGAAALRPFVTTGPDERLQVLEAIRPLWSWHEVWLIAAGGALVLAFPSVFAAAFAGYYLALFVLLWLLVLRGISLEVGRHVEDALWRTACDFVFTGSSALLVAVLGLAIGNIIRGVPLDAQGAFHLAFFTDFGVRGDVGLIDWYTLSFAAFWCALVAAHGTTFLALTTAGPVRERSRAAARRLWPVVLVLAVVVVAETRVVRPDVWSSLGSRPLALFFVAVAAAGAFAVASGTYGRPSRPDRRAHAGSCLLIAGLLAARAAAGFPVLLHSTIDPADSVTAYAAATRHESLVIALVWFTPALLLALLWGGVVSRRLRSRVRPPRQTHEAA
jgi:cytochrome d ubiquinol oxidase subunit II